MALCWPMAAGLNKGHKVTNNVSKPRHSHRHGRLTKYTKCVRDMIQEDVFANCQLLDTVSLSS
ncbi:hypothetical protein J1605_009529 [Eschrichtius robustus]|uniref:Large ribosomal subunit protein eL36 n=1 Tax=Eschrichtius robustus TaxID=9764 RepID=A0AB34GR67_ESCRO|nr:hypothetical protein J1605_009529 [Eschrichtius robustus]